MSIGVAFRNDILDLIYNGTAITGIAQNHATPNADLFVSLHTADPNAGDQTTSEVAYTSYARVAVARTAGGWTITGNSVSPTATISFPAGTGGSGTATHAAVGTLTSGAGVIIDSGALSPTIATGDGITPEIKTTSTITRT